MSNVGGFRQRHPVRWVAEVVLVIFRVVPMPRPVCRNTKTPRPYFTVKRSPKCNYGFTSLRHSLIARNPFHFSPFLAVLLRLTFAPNRAFQRDSPKLRFVLPMNYDVRGQK